MKGGAFLDSDPANQIAREIYAMRDRAAREVAASKIKALVDLIDQRIEAHREHAAPGFGRRVSLTAQNVYRRLRSALGHDLGGKDVAQDQVLDRSDVVIELGKIIFGYRHLDLRGFHLPEATPADPAMHCLSEAPKK